MSLKRRNYIAIALLLLAAVCWVFGQQLLGASDEGYPLATTVPGDDYGPTELTVHIEWSIPTEPAKDGWTGTEPTLAGYSAASDFRSERAFGYVLCIAAVLAGVIAIFVLVQKRAILGPDGACAALAFLTAVRHMVSDDLVALWNYFDSWTVFFGIVRSFVVLLSVRELFGWVLSRFAFDWCFARRMADRCKTAQLLLIVMAGWVSLLLVGAAWCFYGGRWDAVLLLCTAACFDSVCIWLYGRGLEHFKDQLENYRCGEPVIVGEGAFAQTEAQLLEAQAHYEEAMRTAVTSERFKVELIANVSHDLRTPLTAILGYSELLQNEPMSPEGEEQLRRLHQKAGYMNELVESLFELTKVSSGVVESKREQIDLIRLLEQTVGFYEDQLVQSGLTVRRSYCADSFPVISDGARMHQVFSNLLGNAIKYALPGTRIYVEVKESDDACIVRMVNTASYEMDFDAEEILQRFARGDKARSSKGSGLGLAIAKTYTESVGGAFRVMVDGDQFSAIVRLPKTERNL